MLMTPGDEPDHDAEIRTDEQFEAAVREFLCSFVPTETTIDGGLFPSRLDNGMIGSGEAPFHLAPPAIATEETAEARRELQRVFSGYVRPALPLGRSR